MYRSRAPVGGASLVVFLAWPGPSKPLRVYHTPLLYWLVAAQSHLVGVGLIAGTVGIYFSGVGVRHHLPSVCRHASNGTTDRTIMHKGTRYATQYPTYFSRIVVIRADSPPTFTILARGVNSARCRNEARERNTSSTHCRYIEL